MNITRYDELTLLLDQWVECGWLRELDRALVRFLHQECPEASSLLLLGAALVSYQLGRGHVCLDLDATLADSGFSLALPPEGDRSENRKIARPAEVLAGVTLSAWQAALQQPQLVSSGEGSTPLVLVGARLYLRRYWRYEQDVRHAITQQLTQNDALRAAITPAALRQRLDALFPAAAAGSANWQKLACALAAGSAFSIITGGPGTGKTTTTGKLAAYYRRQGKTVLLCAADTFRAAAIEQLEVWGERTGVELIKSRQGGDPSAVLFDALQAAKARQTDVLIVDTAGRLHTKSGLMAELDKMRRTTQRFIPDAPHESCSPSLMERRRAASPLPSPAKWAFPCASPASESRSTICCPLTATHLLRHCSARPKSCVPERQDHHWTIQAANLRRASQPRRVVQPRREC